METRLKFEHRNDFRKWLEQNYLSTETVWLVFVKNDKNAFSHNEALEEALSFGWIDSLIKRLDETLYMIKFSKRRTNSKWSERNKFIVAQLIEKNIMTEHGLAAIGDAINNGNWERKKVEQIPDMVAYLHDALAFSPKHYLQFKELSSANRLLFAKYYIDAKKDDTRKRRLEKIIDCMETGKRLL